MEVNYNYGNNEPKTVLSSLQVELIKSVVESARQEGIRSEILSCLASRKRKAIESMYPNIKVFHEKYGECKCFFKTTSDASRIYLKLIYYVPQIPTDGLSKHDKAIAIKYNYTNGYEEKRVLSYEFKSFNECVTDSISWTFDIDFVTSESFLKAGIICDANKPFAIILK